MVPDSIVIRSELLLTAEEARAYFRGRLARAHSVTCHGRPVDIVFERDATHIFSEDAKGQAIATDAQVVRRIPIGGGRVRTEIRKFSIERARLLDFILPAISKFTVSVPQGGGPSAMGKRVLYGPPLPVHICGHDRVLRVVLRPGPVRAWTVVTAYPVTYDEWRDATRLVRARFPPDE